MIKLPVQESVHPADVHESAVIGDIGDLALEARTDRIFDADAFPRIAFKLLRPPYLFKI